MDSDLFSGKNVVAVPYPGRGHVNPMINLCNLLAAKGLRITFVATEEWLGLISTGGSSPELAPNITPRPIPNVIPSERNCAANYSDFIEAVVTEMGDPFERLLDQLELPVSIIIADAVLPWAVEIGNRRNIPVASFLIMAPLSISSYMFSDVIVSDRDSPVDVSEKGEERVHSIQKADPATTKRKKKEYIPNVILRVITSIHKSQFLLLTTFYELETEVIDSFTRNLPFPCYPIGPSIPLTSLQESPSDSDMVHFNWLNSQPESSVLYISFGSFLSVSTAQMDEIAAGLHASGVRFLWVARDDYLRLQGTNGDRGLVIPWCKQLRTLCHPSIGGFLTHCGWNSTLEAIFAGVPMLTFPIFGDQIPSSKLIVEEWKVGLRLSSQGGVETLVERGEIAKVVERLMDLDGEESKQMRRRAKELKLACRGALEKGGSSHSNLDSFVKDIVTDHGH